MSTQQLYSELNNELAKKIVGEVYFDKVSRVLYSTDASNYQIEPVGVVVPKNYEDVQYTIEIARKYNVSILPRGGGTSLAGQSVGHSIVIDFSKHLNQIIYLNKESKTVTLQPGLYLGQLNKHLQQYNLMFGPDPASARVATIGGVVGNNATGAHSILYGMTGDNIENANVFLSNNSQIELSKDNNSEISSMLINFRDQYGSLISEEFPKHWRRASGYSLNYFNDSQFNPAKLLAGSEGTLAVIKDITLKLVDRPMKTGLAILQFENFIESMESVPYLLEMNPSAVEVIGKMLVDLARKHDSFSSLLSFVNGNPESILAVEFYGNDQNDVNNKLLDFKKFISKRQFNCDFSYTDNSDEINRVWELRRAGLGLLMSKRGDYKPIPCIEDVSVPVNQLASYIKDLTSLISSLGAKAGFYGHASAGCLHVRPLINLKTSNGSSLMKELTDETFKLAIKYGGIMSGEHGDGLQRSYLNKQLFGNELYNAMVELKNLFDPENLLNPGKIVEAQQPQYNLRYDYSKSNNIDTILDWTEDNGFLGAVEMCNGQGVCRKLDDDIMCPSYIATRNERDSTRARANILRNILNGELDIHELYSDEVKDVFDLCIMCKACKSECPSKVDAAKMKMEYLAHYHKRNGYSLRDKLFANIHSASSYGSYLPGFVNTINSLVTNYISEKVGISSQRKLPELSKTKFTDLFRNNRVNATEKKKILYFHDTWTSYYYPRIGISAVNILRQAGCHVEIETKRQCCGRPMLSKGFIEKAKRNAEINVNLLRPYIEKGYIVVGTEPSCILTFRDEYLYLLPGNDNAKMLSENSFLLEEYLSKSLMDKSLYLEWKSDVLNVLIHGHCHQRSIIGKNSYLDILKLSGCNVRDTNAGCCGMAGSFGFESEHYDISKKIGEDRLFPEIRNSNHEVIGVTGVSCYQQIEHFTDKKPKHIAEIISERIQTND